MKRYEISDHTAGCYAEPHEHGSCAECQRLNPDAKELYYLASEVDARIAELEHQLDIRKAAIDAQFRLMERVKVLEKALRAAVDWHSSEDDEAITRQAIDNMRNIARRALGL